MGFALVILSFGALPAIAQSCANWEYKGVTYWQKITLEQIQACIDNGAELHAHNYSDNRMTPLHYVAHWHKNPKVIAVFVQAGANINVRDEDGKTPIHWAASFNEDPKVIEAFLNAGADVHALDKYRSTPLHSAAGSNENPEVTQVLLDAGAKINSRDKYGWTPLHSAANDNESTEVIKVLLDAGANLHARATGWGNDDKITPLHIAAGSYKTNEVIMILLKAGADGKATDKLGRTPFDIAKENHTIKDSDAYWALSDAQY